MTNDLERAMASRQRDESRVFAMNKPHYLPNGNLYKGETHKAGATLMTGAKHSASSKVLTHTPSKAMKSQAFASQSSTRVNARVDVPSYMSENAKRGLAWHADGLSGNGLVDRTVREAREIAAGSVTPDKVMRMSAWFARHLSDLSAPQNKPDGNGYPGPGAVAWALWGGSPANPRQAMDWADARAARK